MVVVGGTVLVIFELVEHEGLVSVLDNRKVLELFQVPWDVRRGNEETSKQHEGNNQDGGKGNGELLVREGGGNDQGVAGESVVDQDQNNQENTEVFNLRLQSNGVVANTSEN